MQTTSRASRIQRGFRRVGFIVLLPCLLSAASCIAVAGVARYYYTQADYVPSYRTQYNDPEMQKREDAELLLQSAERHQRAQSEPFWIGVGIFAFGLVSFSFIAGLGWAVSGFFD